MAEERKSEELVTVEQKGEEPNKRTRRGALGWLRERRVRELVRDKRRLVEVPYTATLADTVNALVANNVVAVPVAAPPGHWIGAGGSMILESDRATGTVRKHYIGMATMLDVLVHIAEEEGEAHDVPGEPAPVPMSTSGGVDLHKKMSVPVSSIIGHSLEGLSLWTLNPHTSILDCMEAFSKGVHRALIPLESQTENVIAVELMEASPGYRMLTQMDVLSYLNSHNDELKDITSCSVGQLGAINENVFAVTKYTKVLEAIKAMRSASLNAIPIVEVLEGSEEGQVLQDGTGTRLVGTLSATDLRSCPIDLLQSSLSITVVDFAEKVYMRNITASNTSELKPAPRQLITCYPSTSLAKVIEKAVGWHVHRVWVVDQQGLLQGLISLTDMLRVIREAALQSVLQLVDCSSTK